MRRLPARDGLAAFRSWFAAPARKARTSRTAHAPPTPAQCPDCIGLGGPHVVVEGAGVIFGNQTNSPQSRLVRRHIFADNANWQHANHRMKFGGEVEHLKGTGTYALDVPAAVVLFSPQEVRQLAPALTGPGEIMAATPAE